MVKIKKAVILLVLNLLIFWCVVLFVDYSRVCRYFEKPLFTISNITADDGGSGKYYGLGYSFNIEGNFMPEDEYPGVTQYDYYIFGKLMQSGTRN